MSVFNGVIKGKVTLNDAPIEGADVSAFLPSEIGYGNSGGEVVTFGEYTLHLFKDPSCVSEFLACKNGQVDVLVVAGGASGGASVGGAGGAGGLVFSPNHSVVQDVYPVTVGAGGAEQTVRNAVGNPGLDSEFDTLVADGGGGGGSYTTTGAGLSGANGGCGGGCGASDGGAPVGGTGTQGGDGGTRGTSGDSRYYAGGGGGMGGNGQDGPVGSNGGDGIYEIEISGVIYNFKELFGTYVGFEEGEQIYFCGGGGGVRHQSSSGLGKHGGGHGAISGASGSGGSGTTVAGAGGANTGGGGGGGSYLVNQGGAGGSGVVIVRCKTSDFLSAPIHIATTDTSGDYLITGLDTTKKYHTTVEYEDLDVPSGQAGIKYNALSKWAIEPIPRLAIAENLLSTPGALASGEIQCDWDTVTSATLYEIEIATDASFTNIITSTTALTNTHTFQGLSDNTPYYWRVRSSADNYYISEWAYADVTEIE